MILFNLSGHGHFDLSSYNKYLVGELQDYDYPEDSLNTIRDHIPACKENADL